MKSAPLFYLSSLSQISLIVNVASECGYTDHNYQQLNQLQMKYGPDRLTVLSFPCNQFGLQEPGDNTYIESLLRSKYKITFPLFSKIDVAGSQQSDVYRYLVQVTGRSPVWNFCKYLVNQEGTIVRFFEQSEPFEDIYSSIDRLMLVASSNNSRQKKEL